MQICVISSVSSVQFVVQNHGKVWVGKEPSNITLFSPTMGGDAFREIKQLKMSRLLKMYLFWAACRAGGGLATETRWLAKNKCKKSC